MQPPLGFQLNDTETDANCSSSEADEIHDSRLQLNKPVLQI